MTTRTLRLPVLALALLSLFATPAMAVDREHQQLEADIRMLQEQAQQLQQMLTSLSDALKQLNSKIDDQTALERKAFADAKVQMDNVSGDLRIVRERADETNVRLSSLAQGIESLRTSLPQPGSMMVPTAGDTPQTQNGSPDGSGTPPTAAPGQTPDRMWSEAYNDYSVGMYPVAIQGFEAYMKYFPKSDMADDAQFQIGESYFQSDKLPDALTAYGRVISDYPTGNQVPNAYYKRGMTLERMRQVDQAKQSYQTVIEKFPESQAATLAKQRLEGLNRPAR